MSDPQEVWVTGMAWCTALGEDLDAVWQALLAGRSGIAPIASEAPLRSLLGAPVGGLDPELPPRARQHRLAATTLHRALQDAGLDPSCTDVLPVLATSYGHHLDVPETESLSLWAHEAAHAAGCRTPPVTVSTACSAGADALLAGLSFLRNGLASACVCGGADILTPGKRLGHSQLGTLASGGLRAFDQAHDGTLLGEGAGFLVLEAAAAARARGARCHGVLAGAGSANDALSAVAPDTSGTALALAVQRALRSAGIDAAQVDLISTHGTGTRLNDTLEATTYGALFADAPRPPLLFGTKGAFGHTLGATGALEAITVLLALDAQAVPPIVGLEQPIADARLPLATGTPTPWAARIGLSVTLGFGGFDTCLVLRRAQETRP
ncbi:beta-ketoacyl-[acyl-carrier-protein] synthase family protein [Xanthomonas campestris pv. phormiicola]|nr:beta-ketoacyl-[acyl-carrier-protein] synthase family protein [Xanthomonas campestris pv. phormiicola]UYC17073.1 beta-ketoacyl-[acyl-carrier-protein] synthase family protein [Xanthomonas campestris pv. phormiicola]